MTVPTFRIGEGWDVHALVEGRPLMLGGVRIEHTHGLLGHSDADDAYKGADSWLLLQKTAALVRAAGYQIGNIDSTVIAQTPKLAGHMPAMCQRIAQALDVDVSRVNVKAKTAEKLGPVGQGLSMEARAIALIY